MTTKALLVASWLSIATVPTIYTKLQSIIPAMSGTTNFAAPNDGDGIHYLGACNLNNVWWADVCLDAATFKQTKGTSYVDGGGTRNAEDKVLQHNVGGTVAEFTFANIKVDGADVVAGVDGNRAVSLGYLVIAPSLLYTNTISNSCILDSSICWFYKGVDDESEPNKTAGAPDGKVCATSAIRTSGC
ncbi:uncharacterized protein BDZ99DRAFT_487008 [Mytilinidion resinicola]|uniref:Pectate lyase n=1 Tax=Mytilinidion resinicola TaxID=574789 RepID=A0A6A6YX52_9PEZI|nr:uncharacterized protein BDZ99DRAFT_487008 [Mytilinidion resinicola]KAF2812487.1 hypothetical protein BDZ99DRAFT_487008 [Mytilinidion resinicola]